MVELVDTRDLKSRGRGSVRAGSSPAPGTTLSLQKSNKLSSAKLLKIRLGSWLASSTSRLFFPESSQLKADESKARPEQHGFRLTICSEFERRAAKSIRVRKRRNRMLQDFQIYDADAHVIFSPGMWATLPKQYQLRRPRAVRIEDSADLGRYTNGWLIDGRILPCALGPGTQPGNEPKRVLKEFGASFDAPQFPAGSIDLSDPQARIRDLDRVGIDVQVLFPTTGYARFTADPGFEAALYRAYNRYTGKQCAQNPKRLKWAGLLPLRDTAEGIKAIEEMQRLGAVAAVVFGTAGERLLSDPGFTPVWDEFARSGLPLCVHMGMSFTPFQGVCESFFEAHGIGMSLPAQMGFVAIVGGGMLDHYLPIDRDAQPNKDKLPRNQIEDYLKSGRIFVAAEAEDPLLLQELALIGEDQILCASDIPHSERRETSGNSTIERKDLSDQQKRKILYDNSVRLFGKP